MLLASATMTWSVAPLLRVAPACRSISCCMLEDGPDDFDMSSLVDGLLKCVQQCPLFAPASSACPDALLRRRMPRLSTPERESFNRFRERQAGRRDGKPTQAQIDAEKRNQAMADALLLGVSPDEVEAAKAAFFGAKYATTIKLSAPTRFCSRVPLHSPSRT
jgi:hypothetical protein